MMYLIEIFRRASQKRSSFLQISAIIQVAISLSHETQRKPEHLGGRLSNDLITLYHLSKSLLQVIATMLIPSKPYRRKPDPFLILLLFVSIGMCVTLTYQVILYSGANDNPIATTQTPPTAGVGG
ncbi:hypothetical protein [Chromatium okenii]|uniref:hypothetical protein n=1 Tax=Chromatium okenii TaxID=61644 RepID=UPI001F5B7B93|nr:hypothetical protein [Chromatium okenii]